MVKGKLQRRHVAVVGLYAALAVGVAGVPVVVSSVSSVARTVTGDAVDLRVSDIDGSRLGRISVMEPQGQEFVVPGVRYRVQRIRGIDLTTESGWNRAVGLSDEQAAAAVKDVGVTKVVDGQGRAVFDGLPVGVYYVSELDPADVPEGYVASASFVLTLPVARVDPDGWRYEVEIYAKGQPGIKDEGESSTPKTTTPVTPVTPVVPPEPGTSTTVTTPRSDTPEKPSTSTTTTPGTPGTDTPDKPNKPSTTEKIRRNLASTGANVLGLIAVGVGLLLLGGFLVARRRRSDEGGE